MLTSCGSSAAHVTCCVGDLCVDSGDMVAIFATRARCSAIGVVVISARVCVSARVLVRDEGGASTCPRRWLVNVSRDLSGGVGAIVGRVRGRGALRVNGTTGPSFVSRKSRSFRERDRETTRANASAGKSEARGQRRAQALGGGGGGGAMRDRTHADASTSDPTPPPRTPPPAPAADSSIAVDMACGAVAGVAYTVSAHPFDTVKVAMQTRPTHPPRSALEVTAEICRGPRGALGLFRGLAAPLVGYSVEAGINYAAFNQGRRWLEHNNPFVVAGAGAGAAAPRDGAGDASPRRSVTRHLAECAASGALGGSLLSLVVAPTDLIKCRIQDGQFRRARDAVADVVTKHGVFGMTRGVVATLAREVPGNALFFTVYEAAQMAFPRWVAHPHPHGVVSKPSRDQNQSQNQNQNQRQNQSAYATQEAAASVVCGGVAGSAFWLAILPIDLAKTRYQIASPGAADDVGVWRLLARELARTGARGLWAGLGPVLARAFPANAVQFLAWEGACQLAGVRREHGR